MEIRMWTLGVVIVAVWFGFLGWGVWQLELSLQESGVEFWSLTNLILTGLGAVIMIIASVLVIAALQPLIALFALIVEMLWQIVFGIFRVIRYLIRRRTHA
ncbi:hypothetical protein HY28_005203 [Salmonella enterica subsp. enterica]|nr:hypothetical protein [Salmonella enterica subsp. enterica serovar Panama]